MQVSKLSRRIGGLTAAIVLGIAGMGVLAAPAQAAIPTATMSMSVNSSGPTFVTRFVEGMTAQVGQELTVELESITPSDATVSWEWFCGDTSRGQKWADGSAPDADSTYLVYPSDIGCKLHAKATIASGTDKVVLDSDAVPVGSVSLSSGYYPNYPSPMWASLLQGYDPSSLAPGYIVVTNWGDTAVTGLSCSITDDTPQFTITAQPDATLAPKTATVVALKPLAGMKAPNGGSDDNGDYYATVTCKDGKGTEWANEDARTLVYLGPSVGAYVNPLQVGTVLDSSVPYAVPTDDTASYAFYFEAADGTKTPLADGYTVAKADIGKDLYATVSVTVPGFDKVTREIHLGKIPPVSLTVSPASFAEQYGYWDVLYGYKAADLDPAQATVKFTNEGTTAITGLTLSCNDTDFVVCGTIPVVTELAPGASTQVTITPKVGAKLGSDAYASVVLRNDDYTVYLSQYAVLGVSDTPIDWIQPGSTTNGGGDNGGGASNGSGSGDTNGTDTSAGSNPNGVDTGGTVSHGSTGIALLGLGFIALGVVILKRRTA